MEGVAMLRQLIGQLQEVLELPTLPSNYFIQFQPASHHQPLRSLIISPFLCVCAPILILFFTFVDANEGRGRGRGLDSMFIFFWKFASLNFLFLG